MKKIKYILCFASSVLILGSCEPTLLPTPDVGPAPTAADLQITITPGADAFHFTIENKSSVTGIATWDLGNGAKGNGNSVTGYYPLPNTYTVTLTLYAKGGNATVTQTITTTEIDWAYFSNPSITLLSGGVDAVNGKTWVMDSLSPGHIGVGPDLANSFQWWAASVKDKSGVGMYDDEFNLKLIEFKVTYDNKGISYVKDFRKADASYSNARTFKGDWMVDYPGIHLGTWSFLTRDGKDYLKLASGTPVFPCFDTGAKDGEYLILSLTETKLELACIGGDGNAWHYLLVAK
ncbi:MAG: PKD domain-containing protein [Bacteroidales bacterium]|jgi:PKD repeat protein